MPRAARVWIGPAEIAFTRIFSGPMSTARYFTLVSSEALVQAGTAQLDAAGAMLCFVLGEPGYYERFGFAAEWAQGFASPYAGEYLMALPLQGGAMPCGVRGAATHAPAFAQLGRVE